MERVDYEKVVVQELLTMDKNGELAVNPWYQRRSVWTPPQRAYLINSIFSQMPIPSIYIRHYLDIEKEKSVKEVVDGQQRMRSILGYARGEFRARHPNHKKPVAYAELSVQERTKFLMTSVSIGYLIGADDADVIEIFGRLNSVAKTLNAQEKRSARFTGEVKQFSLRVAAEHVQLWRQLGLFSANDIARMHEVEFVADLAMNMLYGLSDYSSAKIDKFYKDLNDSFPDQDALRARMEVVFSKIAELDPSAIKDTIFSRSPIFFSLFLVLDSVQAKIETPRLQDTLHTIDDDFNADIPLAEKTPEGADFYLACTASTQRIKSREVRDLYLRKMLRVG